MKKVHVVLFMVVLLAANLVNLSEIFTNSGSKVTPISPRSGEDGLTFNIFGTTPAIADTGEGGGGGGGGCPYPLYPRIQHCDFWHSKHEVVCASGTGTCCPVPCQ